MHRPTRQHKNIATKLERKLAASRLIGKKARRWKKWLETYNSLNKSEDAAEE